jgi:hypothetical protein
MLTFAQIKAATGKDSAATTEDLPRIYALNKYAAVVLFLCTYLTFSIRNFYQVRVDRIRAAEMAKRNRERLSNPTLFPSVPKDNV